MRRLATLFVILCLAFTFTACPGGGGGGKKKEEKKNDGGGGGGEQSGGGGSPQGSLANDLERIRDDAHRVEPDADLAKSGLKPSDLAKGASGPGPLITLDGVTAADVITGSGAGGRGTDLFVLAAGNGETSFRVAQLRREFPGFLDGNRLSREGEQFIQQLEQIPLGDGAIEGYRRRQREFGPGLRALLETFARNNPVPPPPVVPPLPRVEPPPASPPDPTVHR